MPVEIIHLQMFDNYPMCFCAAGFLPARFLVFSIESNNASFRLDKSKVASMKAMSLRGWFYQLPFLLLVFVKIISTP